MSKGIAQLGPDGYVRLDRSPSDILQLELSHMFETDHSQSVHWKGQVESIQWTIKEYGHQPQELASQVKRLLDRAYKPYFEDLETNAYVSNLEEGEYTLSIYVKANYEGREYELGRDLLIDPTEGSSRLIEALNR